MSGTERERENSLGHLEPIEPPRGLQVWLKLGIPALGVAIGAAFLLLALAPELRRNVFIFIGIYFVPGGIDAAPPLGVSLLGLQAEWVVAIVTYFDVWLTLFWVWNLDHLVRFDLVDRQVEKSRLRGQRLWERFPWLRVATGVGLGLFIMLPIPTTGSFTGIAIGKLLELSDATIYVASVVGTFVRVAFLAFGTAGVLWFL